MRGRTSVIPRVVRGLWCATLLLIAAHRVASSAESSGAGPLSESILRVTLNSETSPEALVVLRGAGDEIWIAEDDLLRLRLRAADTPAQTADGRQYRRVNSIPGMRVQIDEAGGRVSLDAPASAFVDTRLDSVERAVPPLTRAAPGAFLNYQLSDLRVQGQSHSGAYAELGVFGAAGVLTNTGVFTHDANETQVVRLETALTHDFPSSLQTLIVGDAISDSGAWGNAVRYGGIRFGRNFAIRPDLITLPTLSAAGSAVIPSTVDVFVNGQRVSSRDVEPGPFVIDRLPSVTGSGEMRVVVRDALGREQVLTQSFYSSNQLLAAGLSAYSISLGRIRQRYALTSNDYGDWLTSGSYRRALNDVVTLEAHLEALGGDARALGLNGAVALGGAGVLSLTAAHGGNGHDSGWLTGAGIERQGRRLNFLVNHTIAEDGFHQIGDTALTRTRYRQRSLVQAGVNLGAFGSLAAAFARQTYRDQVPQQSLSVTYSAVVRERAALYATVLHIIGTESSTSAFLGFTYALDSRRAINVQATDERGEASRPAELYASVQQNPPPGPGTGYRVALSTMSNYDLEWRWNLPAAELELQGVRTQGVAGQSVLFSGAATLVDGELNAARTVNGSFAMVDVAGIAGVPVYVDHQLVAHTNQRGRALLRDLHAYESNRVNVEPTELPLDTSIDARTLVLRPPYRSGVIARFPVSRIRGAVFRLQRDDGSPVPAGSTVQWAGKEFPVALEGQTFITEYGAASHGVASWGEQRCEFELPTTTDADPLPDLGPLACHGGGAP